MTETSTPSPSYTSTGTPSPSFNPASVAVLRVGSGAAAIVSGVAQDLFIDEFSVTPGSSSLVRSFAVNVGANPCRLSAGSTASWLYDVEGIPSLSDDGTFLVFPCYATAAGSPLTSGAGKVAAVVYNTAGVDTSTIVNVATSGFVLNAVAASSTVPRALRGIVSDGTQFWWGTQGYSKTVGTSLAYTSGLGQATIQLCTEAIGSSEIQSSGCLGFASLQWAGALGIHDGSLLYTDAVSSGLGAGLISFGQNVPLAPGPMGALILASAYAPYGFVFAGPSNLWMTETADVFTNNIAQWLGDGTTSQGGGWTRQPPTAAMSFEVGTAIISIAGRFESCGYFVLYATSPLSLYAYNSGTDTTTVLALAPTRTKFRGVTLAPAEVGSTPEYASCTATPTQTPTPSSTVTPPVTASRTASLTATASRTAPSTPTPTKSFGATPTPTGAKTTTPTPSGAKTITPVSTSSPAVTRTPTGTKSPTNTPTHSKTGSSAVTRTATGSAAATRSKTGTAAATKSKTGTPSLTRTKTGTAAATKTPASSKTATASKTSAATKTAAVRLRGGVTREGGSCELALSHPTFLPLSPPPRPHRRRRPALRRNKLAHYGMRRADSGALTTQDLNRQKAQLTCIASHSASHSFSNPLSSLHSALLFLNDRVRNSV